MIGNALSRRARALAAGWLVVVTAAASALGQAPATYTNPIHEQDFPDPFVIADGGRFYAYATQRDESGFQLMESPDLVHWTPRRLEFKIPWAREHYWAPEVVRYQGKFYMTYSALDPKTRRHHIAVATADTPLGPFTHRAILVRGDDNKVGVIDATIDVEDDGAAYLVYSEEDPRRIVLRRLKPDLLAVEGEPEELIRPNLDWEHGVTEAPTLIRRGGKYHLFYSGGPFQGTKRSGRYATGHAVARALKGPYAKTSRPLLETIEGKVYGPGHQCLITTADGRTWVLYHGWDARGEPRYGANPAGRTLRIDPLVWDGDVPRVLGPTLTPQPAPAVGAPAPAGMP
jgi:beta-xylosidase